MKAVVFRRARGLVFEEVAAPEPGDDGVIVKVSDTGFCGSDHSLVESGLLPDGMILGHEISGHVSAVGRNVKKEKEGTPVIIRPTFCGECLPCRGGNPHLCSNQRRTIGIGDLPGAFAEYIKVFPQMLIPIPPGVDSRNAALAETFASALHGIRRAGNPNGSALVMGGGPIGLAAVRILKLLGYAPIVLSEPLPERLNVGKASGADYWIDPTTGNLKEKALEWTGGGGFGTVLECSGIAQNIGAAIEIGAKSASICVISILFQPVTLNQPMAMNFKELRITGSYSNTHEENKQVLEWMASGEIDARPLITDLIFLEQLPSTYKERIHPRKALKVMVKIGEEF